MQRGPFWGKFLGWWWGTCVPILNEIGGDPPLTQNFDFPVKTFLWGKSEIFLHSCVWVNESFRLIPIFTLAPRFWPYKGEFTDFLRVYGALRALNVNATGTVLGKVSRLVVGHLCADFERNRGDPPLTQNFDFPVQTFLWGKSGIFLQDCVWVNESFRLIPIFTSL